MGIPEEFAKQISALEKLSERPPAATLGNDRPPNKKDADQHPQAAKAPAVKQNPPKQMPPGDVARWIFSKYSGLFENDFAAVGDMIKDVKMLDAGMRPPRLIRPSYTTGLCFWKDEWTRINGLATHGPSPTPKSIGAGRPLYEDMNWHKGDE